MLSYSNNIIFIGDQRWKCIVTPCLELQNEYNYSTLHLKLVDTLTQLLFQFPNAKTFSKLDDDGLIHPYLYYDLVNNFESNNYAGIPAIYELEGTMYKFIFMEGVFYMLGREIAECFLRNNLISDTFIGEDILFGKIVSNYCNAKFIDLNNTNMIWHRRYNLGKNKNCNLEQQYENDLN
ncbi:4516_t:CDS:1 [Cetraspora pellucida]|uniref:4516_t:CDS:1 n=1 Tax=Cetraspora pellucida TaxID=1433469 RepID=A0A9N9HE61_9GLOM|nr:4516_t:CDS:1 [Cetraspora pellucida]